jgi:hypothetical protein
MLAMGIVFVVTFSGIIKHLNLLVVEPVWVSYEGVILESYGQLVLVDHSVSKTGPSRKYNTYVKVVYKVNEESFEKAFYDSAFLVKSLDQTSEDFKTAFPPGKNLEVYVNLKDKSEIVIDTKKLKRNKVHLVIYILIELVFLAAGFAMIGLGIMGIISRFK